MNNYKIDKNIDVDHIDKNTKNNRADNLQPLTRKEHAIKDHGIHITEVCETGEIKTHITMTEEAKSIGKNAVMISDAIKRGKKYNGSMWYKTEEYNNKK